MIFYRQEVRTEEIRFDFEDLPAGKAIVLCRFQNEQIKAFWNYAVLTIQLSRHGDKDTLCKTLYGPVIAQVPQH